MSRKFKYNYKEIVLSRLFERKTDKKNKPERSVKIIKLIAEIKAVEIITVIISDIKKPINKQNIIKADASYISTV